MTEIIDNTMQLAIVFCCAISAGITAARRTSQHYFILTCFYGTFALGLLFWLLYLVLMTYTPKIFYVSDLSWVASFLFLLLLDISITTPQQRKHRPIAAWILSAVIAVVTLLLCYYGDVIITLIWSSLMNATAFISTQGLIYARKKQGEERQMQYVHIGILVIVFMEFALWVSSCFFKSGDIANPYFWIDFCLSAALFVLLPAMKRSVK